MINIQYKPQVRSTPAASSADAHAHFASKLAYETDPSDLWSDMQHGLTDFVVLDVRNADAYAKSHIPSAVHLHHGQINAKRMEAYPPDTLFIVYCWGPGCNGSTKAALKLSALGYAVKELIGGIEYWEVKEGYPVERG
jgi:rhodanese-related sulfurtransferase